MRSIRSWHARFVEVMTMFHSACAHHQHANKESTFMPTRIPLQVVRRGIVMDQAQTLPPHGVSRRSGHLSFLKQTTAWDVKGCYCSSGVSRKMLENFCLASECMWMCVSLVNTTAQCATSHDCTRWPSVASTSLSIYTIVTVSVRTKAGWLWTAGLSWARRWVLSTRSQCGCYHVWAQVKSCVKSNLCESCGCTLFSSRVQSWLFCRLWGITNRWIHLHKNHPLRVVMLK